jgi:hypothetical protein
MKKLITLLSMVVFGFAANSQVTVTYQVDITGYLAAGNTLSPNGIRVGGNFADNGATNANWSPADASNAMTDQGNNIWSIDITYPTANVGGTQLYKFVNGDWGTNEGTDPANTIASGGCGIDDGGGNINRTLTIPSAATTVCFTWDACTSCAASLSENAISNVVVAPNPVNDVATFTFNTNGVNEVVVSIFDLAGKKVAGTTATTNTVEINTAGLNAGSYIYQIQAGENTATGKLIKK